MKFKKQKTDYVDPRINFYAEHTAVPRFLFRATGIGIIVCSASLPAFAAARPFPIRILAAATPSLISCLAARDLNISRRA